MKQDNSNCCTDAGCCGGVDGDCEDRSLEAGLPFEESCSESATILELCAKHAVSVVDFENCNGDAVVVAFFNYNGGGYIYQKGTTSVCNHLFFYISAYDGVLITRATILNDFRKAIGSDCWSLA